jgi:hypothetical protein
MSWVQPLPWPYLLDLVAAQPISHPSRLFLWYITTSCPTLSLTTTMFLQGKL